MNHLVYQYSLCAALSLMTFFSLYFLLTRTPEKPIFKDYFRSRRIMGTALLVLSANYAVHLFCGIRFVNHNAAILMNLSTYFLCYWLFSSALMTLLDKLYITVKRFAIHLLFWIIYTGLSSYVLFAVSKGSAQNIGTVIMAACLICYGIWLATRLIRTYKKATRGFKDIHSENIEIYIKWMNVITYWAVLYGVGCGLLTFLPDQYINWWILSSIPFYGYLFYSYQNYMIYHEQIERTLEIENETGTEDAKDETENESPKYFENIENSLATWLESKSYTQSGLTIQDMAKMLDTNRTYLNAFIKEKYHLSFCDWITDIRLEYAKEILKEHPEISIQRVAELSGFMSRSYFTKSFTEKEGCSPAKWKRQFCLKARKMNLCSFDKTNVLYQQNVLI